MAKALRRAVKKAQTPEEAVAKEAEALAKERFGIDVDGLEHVTEVDGQLVPDVSRMIENLLKMSRG